MTLAPPATVMHEPEMIVLAPGQVTYRPAGDFARAGKPIATPFKTMRFPRGLTIMKHQVTRADVLDRIDLHEDFNPREHYSLTLHSTELNDVERNAMGAQSVDEIELQL